MWPQWGVGDGRRRLWLCLSGLVVFLLVGNGVVRAHETSSDPFPVPEVLRPNIAFWTQIFTALDTTSGVLHDANDVTIIYHTFSSLPSHSRQRRRVVDRQRRRYRRILNALAQNRGRASNQEEEQVLALFTTKRTPKVFLAAARNIRFQQGLRSRVARGLVRSGAYLADIEQIFVQAGLPIELALLPHIESSFNNRAYSKAAAVGVWQFIYRTGRRFLTINDAVDERLDVHSASVAAAKLLRENYQELGTWPLAITAYNHGAHGMKRATAKLGTKDFGTIVQRYRSRLFGFASKNFYAEFLAIIAIIKNHEAYFKDLTFDPPLAYHTLKLDAYVAVPDLETYLGLDRQAIARWNPALRPSVLQAKRRVPKGYVLKIPAEHLSPEEIQTRWAEVPSDLKVSTQVHATKYRVRAGDTLSAIARRFSTTVSVLARLNDIQRPYRIRAGQGLRLPLSLQEVKRYRVRAGDTLSTIARRLGTTVSALARLNNITRPYRIRTGQVLQVRQSLQEVRRYRVRSGDTLSTIARRFGTTVSTLAQLNSIRRPYMIRAGQILRLPQPSQQSVG